MNSFSISTILISLVAASYENEYRTNEHFLYAFSSLQGNMHENYAFCSNLGMSVISINTETDETTIRGQDNQKIDWIWIQSTFRNITDECPFKCCAPQMKATLTKKDSEFRSESYSSPSGFFACQQVLYKICYLFLYIH